MPGKMARSDPRPGGRVIRGAGSSQHLASVLQGGRENANIDAGLGFIWRISANSDRRAERKPQSGSGQGFRPNLQHAKSATVKRIILNASLYIHSYGKVRSETCGI
jgi:hypothetical protein